MSEPMFKLVYGRDLKPEDWDAEACLLFPETYLHPSVVADLPLDWADNHDGETLTIVSHSQEIIVRFMEMVKFGTLQPEDVELEWEGEHIPIKANGDFEDDLRGGFFEEVFSMLFHDEENRISRKHLRLNRAHDEWQA